MKQFLSKGKNNKLLSTPSKLALNVAIVGGTAFGLKFLVDKVLSDRKKEKAYNNSDKTEVQQAQALRAAFNPSGVNWAISMDTTNVEQVYAVASAITDFNKVRSAYKDLYSEELNERLRKELSSSEFTNFQTIIARRGQSEFSYAVGDVVESARDNVKLYQDWNKVESIVYTGDYIGEILRKINVRQSDGSIRKGYLVLHDSNRWNPFNQKAKLRVYESDVLKTN